MSVLNFRVLRLLRIAIAALAFAACQADKNFSTPISPSPQSPPPEVTTPGPEVVVKTTSVDTILSFGDSITNGNGNTAISYPIKLQALLQAQYSSQTIIISNAGIDGELAMDGIARLAETITLNDDLVILLEGVNDTNNDIPTSSIINALESMVQISQASGKEVILCTLTPVFPNANGHYKADPIKVEEINAQIPSIAARKGAILVDMYAAFGTDTSLMSDGLHPTDAGYQLMAEVLFNAIVTNFESTETLSH
jgi:lysophospholipase L1-like esterase